jgi:hypothetical protein
VRIRQGALSLGSVRSRAQHRYPSPDGSVFRSWANSASKSTAERFNCWALRTDTSPMPLPLVQELWSYLDENEEGHIEYDEFVEALSVASEMINTGPVTWGKMHEDFEYDPEANSITATGSCLCVYLCVRTCGIRAWRIGTNCIQTATHTHNLLSLQRAQGPMEEQHCCPSS